MRDDGTRAVDVANLPWSQMTRSDIRPKADKLKAEIICRWNVICAGTPPALNQAPKATPRPKQWSLSKVQKWLKENPIGREFLLAAAVDERLVMVEKAAKETEEESSLFNKRWIGKEPILRLIHALIDDDDIKWVYLVRLDVSSDRMVIENCNTPESKAASVWALMSRKWNNPQFLPSSMIISLQSDFHDPIAIDHDVVSDMTPATPEKVKEKWVGFCMN